MLVRSRTDYANEIFSAELRLELVSCRTDPEKHSLAENTNNPIYEERNVRVRLCSCTIEISCIVFWPGISCFPAVACDNNMF